MQHHLQPSGLWVTIVTTIRYRAALAVVGFLMSAAGGVIEVWWWMDTGPSWHNLYRFLFAGAPFGWSLALHLAGGTATITHWQTAHRRHWWALPGGMLFVAWLVRGVVGLLLWVVIKFGPDIASVLLEDKGGGRRRRRRRR